jgi:tRNA modification GTPase
MTATSLTGDTIAAIATAVVPQQGSVGIVRVSGDEAVSIAKKLFHAPGSQPWESHRILYGFVKHPETGNTVDEALLLLMLAPKSYTREDVVEFHCHGGIIAVQQVLQLCLESGARLAQQGEFTLRAFLNGRLDLTQAESIADLVGAQSPAAAQSALAGLQGKLATPIRSLRSTCLDILAEIEARIDFEENLPPLDIEGIVDQIQGVNREVSHLLETADRGELLRSGLKVAIVGRPNVGKSSLLNAWSRSDRAIVTELPGTTRDVVESQLVVQGIPVQVLDTAGIREASDQVEKMGVQRSREAAEKADLILLAIDAQAGWTQEDAEIYYNVNQRPVILVVNKVDLLDGGDKNQLQEIENAIAGDGNFIQIVKTAAAKPEGIDQLENAIAQAVHTGNLQAADTDLAINQRQAAALTRAKNALEQVQKAIADDLPLDFWTIDLREATQAFGEVTGDEITESMLDRIFSRFCIGK